MFRAFVKENCVVSLCPTDTSIYENYGVIIDAWFY